MKHTFRVSRNADGFWHVSAPNLLLRVSTQEGLDLICEALRQRGDEIVVDSTSDDRVVNNVMRHEYRVLSDDEKGMMKDVKDMGLAFHSLVDAIGSSREVSIAKTKIEEAVMWAVKAITQ